MFARVERVENEELRDRRRRRRRRWRWRPAAAGTRQDASEPSGNFPVAVSDAPPSRHPDAGQHTHLVIAVRNTGSKAIPNIAVTICNVTCAYPAPPGEGTSAAAFAQDLRRSRTWPTRRGRCGSSTGRPGPCTLQLPERRPGRRGVTAYSNTWALGRLAPGRRRTFDWARDRGRAGPPRRRLAGRRRAERQGQGGAGRRLAARTARSRSTSSTAPAQSYVNNNGQIVTTPAK